MPKKHYFAQIPTIAIFIAFAISGPLGLLLFILKHIDKDSLKKEQANAAYASDFRASDTRPGAQAQPAAESPLSHDLPTAEQKKSQRAPEIHDHPVCCRGRSLFAGRRERDVYQGAGRHGRDVPVSGPDAGRRRSSVAEHPDEPHPEAGTSAGLDRGRPGQHPAGRALCCGRR